jgi:hypothetical protein
VRAQNLVAGSDWKSSRRPVLDGQEFLLLLAVTKLKTDKPNSVTASGLSVRSASRFPFETRVGIALPGQHLHLIRESRDQMLFRAESNLLLGDEGPPGCMPAMPMVTCSRQIIRTRRWRNHGEGRTGQWRLCMAVGASSPGPQDAPRHSLHVTIVRSQTVRPARPARSGEAAQRSVYGRYRAAISSRRQAAVWQSTADGRRPPTARADRRIGSL